VYKFISLASFSDTLNVIHIRYYMHSELN
jgi:hypothetical protein